MVNSVDHMPSEAWHGYPGNLQHLDISDTLPHKEATIAHVKNILCSQDESYTELLEFGVQQQDNDEPPEPGLDLPPPIPLRVVPIATGEDSKDRLSITADEFQALLHDFQVEPNFLYLFYQALDLGQKSHFGPNGETMRKEVWFSLPFPDDSKDGLDIAVRSCVVWFDYVPDTRQTRILLFRPPSDVLSKLRYLEAESGPNILYGYQIILFLYNLAVAKWFSKSQLNDFLEVLNALHANTPVTTANTFFGAVSKLDEHLLEHSRQTSMVASMITLTEFLRAEVGAFGVGEDRHHKAVFEEHIQNQTHRLRLLAIKFDKVRDRSLDRKASMLCRPPVANAIATREICDLLKASAPKLLDMTDNLATESRGGVKVLANVVQFYLPWITVASIFGALSITGNDHRGLAGRVKQYVTVAGPLVGLTFVNWRLHQYTISLHYGTKRLFTSMRDTTIRFFNSLSRSPREASNELQETAETDQVEESTMAGLSGLSMADRRNLLRNLAISRARTSVETGTAGGTRQNGPNGSNQDEGNGFGDLLVTLFSQAAEAQAEAEAQETRRGL